MEQENAQDFLDNVDYVEVEETKNSNDGLQSQDTFSGFPNMEFKMDFGTGLNF